MQETKKPNKLLSVEEAQRLVLEHARPLPPRHVPLEDALGLYLAQGVTADLDNPPFDKSLVDGYAVRFEDVRKGLTTFRLVGTVAAGGVHPGEIAPGETVRIMTGAPLPAGADAVVMQEDVSATGESVHVLKPPSERFANVLRRGATVVAGDVVLRKGIRLKPPQIALLAECGVTRPLVYPRPAVGIVTTGDEVVPASDRPGPGEIRNTNAPMLTAAAAQHGGEVRFVRHARDDRDELRTTIAEAGEQCDVLLLTGGVSVGDRDCVAAVLSELGVHRVFHGVRVRPGKPLYFGVWERTKRIYVFGLPGNPVSSLVGFLLFVRPLLRVLAGAAGAVPARLPARLAEPWRLRCERPTYWPAAIWYEPAGLTARPLPWKGSPDIRTVATADGFLFLPEGTHDLAAGSTVEVVTLD